MFLSQLSLFLPNEAGKRQVYLFQFTDGGERGRELGDCKKELTLKCHGAIPQEADSEKICMRQVHWEVLSE